MGLHADSARPQRVSGSARTDSRRAESARNPIASHANFGNDSALSAFTRTQWTAAFTHSPYHSAQFVIRIAFTTMASNHVFEIQDILIVFHGW